MKQLDHPYSPLRRSLVRCWLLFRSVVLAGCVSLGFVLLAASWVQAKVRSQLGDEGLHLGRSLFDSLRQVSAADAGPLSQHDISFNGMLVRAQSFTLHGKPEELITDALQALREECQTPREAAASEPLSPEEERGLSDIGFDSTTPLFGNVMIESVEARERAFYCFKPAHPLHLRGIAAMAHDFDASGDLSDLGTWRGIYAKSGEGTASFLSLEGQGPFKPEIMFPLAGDAPGQDFNELPRPSGTRTLSIAHEGVTALNTYQSDARLSDNLIRYQQALQASPVHVERPSQNGTPGDALFVRSSTTSYIVSGIQSKSGSTIVIAALPD